MSAGIAAAEAGVRPRLPAQPRREDVQVGRQCRRSASIWPTRFGVDALRYFLLREVTFGQDGSYSAEAIVTRANADLANSFGNLAQRTLSLHRQELRGRAAARREGRCGRRGAARFGPRGACATSFRAHFEALALSQGIEAWLQAVFACNQYIDAQAPWALRKSDPERMNAVLATLYEAIADLAIAIQPIIPAAAARLLDRWAFRRASATMRRWTTTAAMRGLCGARASILRRRAAIFPRLEAPAEA